MLYGTITSQKLKVVLTNLNYDDNAGKELISSFYQ